MRTNPYEIRIETDKEDVLFPGSFSQMVARNCIVKESKLVEMVDELDLWSDIGGSLNVISYFSSVMLTS